MSEAKVRHAKWLMLTPVPIWTTWYLAAQSPGVRWEDLFPVFWPLNAVAIIFFFAGLIEWTRESASPPVRKPRRVPAGADIGQLAHPHLRHIGPMGPRHSH